MKRGWLIALTGLALAVVVLVAGTMTVARATDRSGSSRCAYFSESIGLYTGNPVTQMGYPIGTVTDVEPKGAQVRVDFDLSVDRKFPANVKAVIRSRSLLADRQLELVGNYEGGPELPADQCISIDHTATPKSLSEITGSASDFLKALSPDNTESVATAVAELDEALKGQGDNIHSLLTSAAGAMSDPDQMVADVGSIITNLAPFSTTALENWSTAEEMLAVMPKDLEVASTGLWAGVAEFIDGLGPVVAVIYDIQRNYGGDVEAALDYASVGLRIAAGRSDDIKQLLEGIPAMASLVKTDTAAPGVRIRHPRVEVRAANGKVLCQALQAVRPGSCSVVGDRVRISDLNALDGVLAQARR
ncbi:MlaD family protein [Gordonia rubripertincta]|uniref:MlaD family protein n=1 Tax=Gordonia rubripertincta TaxID=36822 RepID=UPI0013C33774|nr:MlaD family protein [Gordonia rubripertincta]